MKTIMYVVSTLMRCGPTNQLYNIVDGVRKNHNVVVVTLSPECNISMKEKFTTLGITVLSLNLGRVSGFFYSKTKLLKIIRDINPVIIHSQGFRGDLLVSSLGRLTNTPTVSTIRNIPHVDYVMLYGYILGHVMASLHLKALRCFSAVVGVSSSVSANLLAYNKSLNVIQINNGVDTTRFPCKNQHISKSIREKIGISKSSFVWISVGDLIARKRFDFLVESFMAAFKMDCDVNLIVVGDGPLLHKCKQLAADSPNIFFVGAQKDVSAYLMAADGFVSASCAEGFPNAALEALSTGLPCLLSDILPHKEIIDIDPNNYGKLFPLIDSGGFKDLILKCRSEFQRYDADVIAASSFNQLSSVVMANKYGNLYLNLIVGNVKD